MKLVPILLIVLFAACGSPEPTADAYGNFEATEVTVSAENAGKLVRFDPVDGAVLEAGVVVALIDTVQLALRRDQLLASRRAVRARSSNVQAQLGVIDAQVRVAKTEQSRIQRLLEDGAIAEKSGDDVAGQLDVLDSQARQVRTQFESIAAELAAIDAQLAQTHDLIRRSSVVNPVSGTVLLTFVEPFELAGAGRPLYRIADLNTLELRAYVSGSQLPQIRLGQPVEIRVDDTNSTTRALAGEISWIASRAEFTPKTIQTREERVNLVYAIKVRVENRDGLLKIGMPGEVYFASETS